PMQLLQGAAGEGEPGAHRPFVFVEFDKSARGGGANLFQVREEALLILKTRVFADLEPSALDFLRLERQEIDSPQSLLLVLVEAFHLAREFGATGEKLSDPVDGICETSKLVQQVELRLAGEQGRVFALTVHLDQLPRQRPDGRGRHRLVVYQQAAPATRVNLATKNHFRLLAALETVFLKPRRPGWASRPRLTSRLALLPPRKRPVVWRLLRVLAENGGHNGPVGAGADDLRRRSPAQRQAHSVHQNGLARASLPREQIQPATELDGEVLNHRVVLNMEFVQHQAAPCSVAAVEACPVRDRRLRRSQSAATALQTLAENLYDPRRGVAVPKRR